MSTGNTKVSLPIPGLLGIAFVVLKLCNVIHWSWWLVLLPLYGGAALSFILLFVAALLFGAADVTDELTKQKQKRTPRVR